MIAGQTPTLGVEEYLRGKSVTNRYLVRISLFRFPPLRLGQQAINEISSGLGSVLSRCEGVVVIGGDHTISYPCLKVNASFFCSNYFFEVKCVA